jgi:hypothetical protein
MLSPRRFHLDFATDLRRGSERRDALAMKPPEREPVGLDR